MKLIQRIAAAVIGIALAVFLAQPVRAGTPLWREGKKMGGPLNEHNKAQSVNVSGKFESYRLSDNSIVLMVDEKKQKRETIFIGKDVKLMRGDKEIQPRQLKSGDVISASGTKTQGKITASQITVAGK